MRRNQIIKWHGFKGRIEEIYSDSVRIRLTTTWAPIIPNNEIQKAKAK